MAAGTPRSPKWDVRSGDLVLVPEATPTGAIISESDSGLDVNVELFANLLELLESVVLYDRLVVGVGEFESPLSKKGPLHEWFHLYRILAKPVTKEIEADMIQRLREAQVVTYLATEIPDVPARQLFERQLNFLPSLARWRKGLLRGILASWPKAEREELATLLAWVYEGRPLYIAEAAGRAGVPFQAYRLRSERILLRDRHEQLFIKSVMAHVRERLDEAVASELDRLAQFTHVITFPRSAIAWQLIAESRTASDLVQIALQLRRDYTSFRARISELEMVLRSDEATIKQKMSILKEIEALFAELWPTQERAFRREMIATTSLIAALPTSIPGSLPTIASLASTLLSTPVELVIKAMRRHRYRMLFRNKRVFLRSRDSVRKLAKLFGVKEEVIRAGLSRRSERRNRTA